MEEGRGSRGARRKFASFLQRGRKDVVIWDKKVEHTSNATLKGRVKMKYYRGQGEWDVF